MLTIDTHCHVGLDWFEPVEVLLFQMDRNQVDKAVLIQTWTFDNTYLLECLQRFPGRFAAVGYLDISQPDAPATLESLKKEGLQGVRFSLIDDSGSEALMALLRKAEQLKLVVSCLGLPEHYASDDFRRIIEAVPDLRIMIEHLGYAKHTDPPPYETFRKILSLAKCPNVFMKVHGLGEIMPRPAPMTHPPFDLSKVPPFIDMAFDAFGANRLTIGTDSPPCSHREGYRNVVHSLREYLSRRTRSEIEAVCGKTAASLFTFGDEQA